MRMRPCVASEPRVDESGVSGRVGREWRDLSDRSLVEEVSLVSSVWKESRQK